MLHPDPHPDTQPDPQPDLSVLPFADRILILPIEAANEVGGMLIPESQLERPFKGTVLAVGPGRVTENGVRVPPECQVGDIVSFPTYAGKDFEDDLGHGMRKYLLVRQDELFLNHGKAPKHSQDEKGV